MQISASRMTMGEGPQESSSSEFPWMEDINASNLEFVEELGRGSGGVVQKVIYTPQNFPLALKVRSLVDERYRRALTHRWHLAFPRSSH